MRESDIEKYLVRQVEELGGETRKVQWVGRKYAPDRVVMLRADRRFGRYGTCLTLWVEVKEPGGLKTFPKNAHERGQAREHERMRAVGQIVVVVDSYEGVGELLA